MEVILREDIDKPRARAAQVVKVTPGYARNFLLPKRMAVAATESNKKIVEQERQAHLRREAKESGGRGGSGEADGGGGSDHRAEGRRKRSVVRIGDGGRYRGGARKAGLHDRPAQGAVWMSRSRSSAITR